MEVKPGYKQTEVGVIPEEWDVRRLTNLLEHPRSVRYGIVQPGKFDPRGCLMLRSQDYSKGWAGPDEMHRVTSQLENQYRNARIQRDDLVMTVVGAGIGQVVIAPAWLDGAILSRSTARIAVDESQASRAFVKASLESPVGKRQIFDCQKEGAQPVVSCQDLAKFFIPYPSPTEQGAIAEALSDVDALLGALDWLIVKKRDLKQAAMQQLLTGQTRLPGFHGEWVIKTLGRLIKEIGDGATPSTADARNFGGRINWIVIDDIKDEIATTSATLTERGLQSCAATLWPPGTLILSTGATIGEVGIARIPVATKQGICGIVFDQTQADAVFMKYWFVQNKPKLLGKAQGSTIKEVRAPTLVKIELTVPNVLEQTAIAEVLTNMDAELAALQQRREKTRGLKEAMMHELLTGKIRLVPHKEAHA
jgi:type I restriction enzyme S subunit